SYIGHTTHSPRYVSLASLSRPAAHRQLHSFPTRRSSDLMLAAASLHSDRWDESLLRALYANLRTTGPLGFRSDRIDMPQLEKQEIGKHTSELQSQSNLVCRLLLEKKKTTTLHRTTPTARI